jgi:transposase
VVWFYDGWMGNSDIVGFDSSSLFASALGVGLPWRVDNIKFDLVDGHKELHLYLGVVKGTKFACEGCGGSHSAYDKVERTWKHLRFFEHPTYIHAWVPRIRCSLKSTVSNVMVPWARASSGFTLLFEAFVLELAKEIPMSMVGEMVGESGQTIFRILDHYVQKARAKENYQGVRKVGIDETSFSKGHKYVTCLVDSEHGKVLSLTAGKDHSVIDVLIKDFEEHDGHRSNINEVSCDLSRAFRKGVKEVLPGVVVTSDRFHVMQLVSKAQDKVRQREYSASKSKSFKNMRFALLSNPENQSETQKLLIEQMKTENNDTVQAYQMRLMLKDIYDLDTHMTARDSLGAWIEIVEQSHIPEMIKVARTIKEYLEEILQYFISRMTNAIVEGINTMIQSIKRRAKGYRNINNFITMIYLKCGKLKIDIPNIITYPL